ncbi:MFS family permease [Actinoplanes lutulentus]|uniref:Multidrug efflux pump Tap n=1 Tax=Actinoplanes lutulentus TaxID=1287878 RepID=A0A327YWQ0_9ACTN|nr:MFS transporter [Actinoplanes lutulentus]MBB2940382.1 MFS family permease [Actinoplanes lutulentus]RAK25884.1 transmembrane secretion effector [Actinoplanes lutulentus]
MTVLAANLVSIAGNCLTYMGVPWFVLQSTGSAVKAGTVAFCTLLPAVLAALVTGPVIDRMGRRRVSVASDLTCGAAVAAIPLLQFAGILQFWMLCALMALTGLFRAPGETARGVLLPALAERAAMPLTRAAGLYDGAARCAALTASALGGVLIAVLGADTVLLVDAATFAVAAPLFAFGVRDLPEAQPLRQVEPVSLPAYRRELAEGYRFVAATPLLLGLCLMTLVTRGLDQGWSAVLLPVHAREQLAGAIDLGLLNAAFGICALTGALIYGAVGSRFRRWPVFTVAFLIGGLPRFVVAAFTDTFTPLAVIMAVEGLAFGVLNPIITTVTYETVPEELRSRVLSATTAAVQLITPLGGLAAGFLVDASGLPGALLTVGGVYLLATLCPVVFPAWRQMDSSGSLYARTKGSPSRSSKANRMP